MLLRRRKLLWSLVKLLLVLGVRNHSRLHVMFGAFVSRIKHESLIILLFSYVILFLYTLICHYMHETWSWHAYSYALGFLQKIGCDSYSRCNTGSSGGFFGQSTLGLRMVRPALANSSPPPRGQSIPGCADCLSPLLLELRFRVALSWGLFLGLVGSLWLRDLDKLMWASLVVNLGHRPS
jgi:hypothetical protein